MNMEAIEVTNQIVSSPFLVLSLAVTAITLAIRKTAQTINPKAIENKWFKACMPWLPMVLGVAGACAVRGMGAFDGNWGWICVLGIFAGFAGSWLWSAIKPLAKSVAKLS